MSASVRPFAQTGDVEAFVALTAPYRRELHLHCYRMLGSVTDADDLLQETMVAAWQGLDGFAWLQPYPDAWLDPMPGPSTHYQTREDVRLAFVAALQRLPPRQTAVVTLCDVLDFSLAEVATMLETTTAAVKGLLQRGRASLGRHHLTGADAPPEPGPPAEPGSAANTDLAQRFADAFSADDVDAVVALLTDDAWLSMPPAPHEYQGVEAIAGFLRASAAGRAGQHLGLLPTRANAQPAFACYLVRPGDFASQPSGLIVLTLAGERIAAITRFLDPKLPSTFGFGNALAGTGVE